MISIKKTHNVFTFLLHLLSIVLVMASCDEPNKPNNGGGGTSLAAPVISTHPTSQSISEGSIASLSVKATHPSGAKLSYQWQRAASNSTDFENIARATDTIYTTPTLTAADNGTQYRVLVTATNNLKQTNSVKSSIATITVSSSTSSLAVPSITLQPASQTISEGAMANLSVEVTQISEVKFSYQWQKAAKGSNDFTDVKGADAGSYTTPTLTAADNGVQYRVLVTAANDLNETKSVTSDVATITVSSSTSSLAAPTITVQPASQTISEGATANLSVKATHPSGATLFYQWQKAASNSIDFDNIENAIADSYTTPTLTAADNGTQYRVLVTAINESKETKSVTSDVAIITVSTSPPVVSTQIEWTHTDGTKHKADVPADGILLSSVLTQTKTDIKSVDIIPNSIKSIGENAFYECTALTSITIPNSVTSIGKYAFYGCTALESINLPNTLTSIEENVFQNCSRLTSITLPNSLKSIGYGAFLGCSGITSITIPNNVTSIGASAFQGCSGFMNITITSSVTSIGKSAFLDCSSLTNVRVERETPPTAGTDMFGNHNPSLIIRVPDAKVNDYKAAANWITYKDRIYGHNELRIVWTHIDGTKHKADVPADGILLSSTLTQTKTDIKSVDIIPSSITSMGWDAFADCKNLTSITIPSSVTNIQDNAFARCTSLASITIPNSVTSMGANAFFDCTALANVTISDRITSIAGGAFYNCTSLTNIPITSNITSIGIYAFYGCSGLTSITIPSSVTSIGDNAFQQCTSLASITIPSSVTSIGNNAFQQCTSLASITIPNSIKSIGESTFAYCTSLASITIPNSVISIGNNAFEGCSGFTSITIPSSVISIGNNAFAKCTNLMNVRVEQETPPTAGTDMFTNYHPSLIIRVPDAKVNDYRAATNWSVYKPIIYGFNETIVSKIVWTHTNGSKQYTDVPTNGILLSSVLTQTKTDIKSVDIIPSGITSIGVLAFSGCTALTSITLPSSITSIGNSAFYNCKVLTSITIPNSVTSIGNSAFEYCKVLASVKVEATTPPTAGTSMFNGTASNLSIQVPSGSVNAYKGAWGNYAGKITGY